MKAQLEAALVKIQQKWWPGGKRERFAGGHCLVMAISGVSDISHNGDKLSQYVAKFLPEEFYPDKLDGDRLVCFNDNAASVKPIEDLLEQAIANA